MEELIKFLTSKIGYTVLFALCIFAPGNLFVFVWNQELYLEMDIVKLIILTSVISCVIYAVIFGILVLWLFFKKDIFNDTTININDCFSATAVFTFITINSMSLAVYSGYKLDDFIPLALILLIGSSVMILVIDELFTILKKIIKKGRCIINKVKICKKRKK